MSATEGILLFFPAVYPIGTWDKESDRSPSPIAEINNAWNYKCTPPRVFKAWGLIKPRTRLYF
jgi:hypothetical protein